MAPVEVIYCGLCGVPPEYCEFGSAKQPEKCRQWLMKNHADIFQRLYPDMSQEVTEQMAQATVEDDNGEKKAPQKPNKKAVPKQIVIKRTERNKRKHITTISHLDLFDVDLKKAAKLFANRFACGSSVTKSPSLMKDEIVVQGDVQYDVIQVIVSNFPQIKESDIVIVEPKPKKGEAAASE